MIIYPDVSCVRHLYLFSIRGEHGVSWTDDIPGSRGHAVLRSVYRSSSVRLVGVARSAGFCERLKGILNKKDTIKNNKVRVVLSLDSILVLHLEQL